VVDNPEIMSARESTMADALVGQTSAQGDNAGRRVAFPRRRRAQCWAAAAWAGAAVALFAFFVRISLWYDPSKYDATFAVADAHGRYPVRAFEQYFGQPSARYRVNSWYVLVYRTNLLRLLLPVPH
jgi:hypothetical protein